MIPFLEVSVIQALLAIGLIASSWYYLLMLYASHDFFRRTNPPPPTNDEPPVSVLKPLKGDEPHLYEDLASLCRQHYGAFQVLCGVASPDDSAIPVVRQLQADFPEVDLELVVDPRVHGSNYKVSNLENMYQRAKYDILVIADSDIRVQPRYLSKLVAQLADAETGLVTCLYRAGNSGGAPGIIEALFVNTDFCGMVLVARKVETPSYAFGATIAIRREVLEEIGGFLPIASHLADDYQIGNRIGARGYKVVLSDEIVGTLVTVDTWRKLLNHQLRWARTYRACRPTGYFSTIITHGTLWVMANLFYNGFSSGSLLVAGVVLGLRYLCAGMLTWPYLHASIRPHHFLLLSLKDLFLSLVWFLAFAGDRVWWSGRRFQVRNDGTMVDLTPGARLAGSWEPQSVGALPERNQQV